MQLDAGVDVCIILRNIREQMKQPQFLKTKKLWYMGKLSAYIELEKKYNNIDSSIVDIKIISDS